MCEVLDYFLWCFGFFQVVFCVLVMKGLLLVFLEGSLWDGEEKEFFMEEDVGDIDVLQGYQWLLWDLFCLFLFDSVRSIIVLVLQQVIYMEIDFQIISVYLIYLFQYMFVEEQVQYSDLVLDVVWLVVECFIIMFYFFLKFFLSVVLDVVLSVLLFIFLCYVRCMWQSKEGEEVYSWLEFQDQVFLCWSSGEIVIMYIFVVYVMVILLMLGLF